MTFSQAYLKLKFHGWPDSLSNYDSSDVSTALMEQLHSFTLCTAEKVSSLTKGNMVMMATFLHQYFHISQSMPTVNPDNAMVPPQNPNGQQQKATETNPPAGNNLFSQQFINQLSSFLHQFMPLAPLQQSQILEQNYGIDYLLHYLNDIFTAGPADSNTCEENLHAILALCAKLNVAIKPSQVEGPTTSLTFLDIHLNTTSMEASITSKKAGIITRIILIMY